MSLWVRTWVAGEFKFFRGLTLKFVEELEQFWSLHMIWCLNLNTLVFASEFIVDPEQFVEPHLISWKAQQFVGPRLNSL